MGSNWNNKFFIVERVIILPDLCERQMHACVDHYTVCNDFNSKENSVYYYFFQNHANPRDIVLLFGTPIPLLKVNDAMVQVKIIMLHEKWMAFLIYIFVIAQSEAKGLELCTNLVQCCVLICVKLSSPI